MWFQIWLLMLDVLKSLSLNSVLIFINRLLLLHQDLSTLMFSALLFQHEQALTVGFPILLNIPIETNSKFKDFLIPSYLSETSHFLWFSLCGMTKKQTLLFLLVFGFGTGYQYLITFLVLQMSFEYSKCSSLFCIEVVAQCRVSRTSRVRKDER